MFVRTPFNYDMYAASQESGVDCTDDENRTKQEFAAEVDINTILKRFSVTGQLPQGVRMPTYGDFTGVSDFRDAANAIAVARESFDAMPADVRRRFENDPSKFVDFCSDPANLDECRKMGLAPPVEVKASSVDPSSPSPVAPAASSASSGVAAPAVPAAPAASGTSPT